MQIQTITELLDQRTPVKVMYTKAKVNCLDIQEGKIAS